MMKSEFKIALGLVIALCGSACEEEHGEGKAATTPDNPANVELYDKFDVEWVQGTAIIDDVEAVQNALVSMDYETGELVLRSDFSDLNKLNPGTTAVLGGIGIFKITDRTSASEGEKLILETAALTDVIENGVIGWRRDFLNVASAEKLALGIDEDESDSIRSMSYPLSGSYADDELEFKGEIAGFSTAFSLSRLETGYGVKLSAERSNDGTIAANFVIEGELSGLTNETNIVIAGGSVTDFSVRVEGLEGKLDIAAGAVELGKGEAKIAIPARISLPLVLGGIPFRIDLGGSLEIQSSIGNQTAAILHAETSFSGNCGFRYQSGKFTVINEMNTPGLKTGSIEHVGAVTSGLGVLLNFPEVGIGIGVPKMAEGRLFLRMKSEIVSNMVYYYDMVGGMLIPDGGCAETGVNFGAFYGGSLSFAGLADFETEQLIYSLLGEKSKFGDACEQ